MHDIALTLYYLAPWWVPTVLALLAVTWIFENL